MLAQTNHGSHDVHEVPKAVSWGSCDSWLGQAEVA